MELKGTELEDRDQIPLTGDGNKSQSDECETKQIELGINNELHDIESNQLQLIINKMQLRYSRLFTIPTM